MYRWFSLFVLLATALPSAGAQVSLTGGTYVQDFNTLAASGTSSTVPAGWAFAEAGAGANTSYTADNGGNSTGDTYSYGTTGSADRAFGTLQGGNLSTPRIGAAFTNNTGATITGLVITYTGEQWRHGNGATDQLDFQYSLDATSLTTGTWTDVNALDFVSPVNSPNNTALDGNAAPNRTRLSATITGLNIANGSTFRIRWTDLDSGGQQDGLAVDDVAIAPTPASVTRTATGQAGWRLLAPPVAGMSVGTLAAINYIQGVTGQYPSAQPNIFTGYNGDNGSTDNGFSAPASTTTGLTQGRGFIWYFYDANFGPFSGGTSVSEELPDPLPASGTATTNNVTVQFTAAERGTSDDQFYMLGNPYATSYDLSGVTVSSGTLSSNFQVWDPNAGSYGTRTVASEGPNANVTTDDLAPWQGAFAQFTTAPTLPVTFTYNYASQINSGAPFAGRLSGLDQRRDRERRIAFALTGETADGPTYDEAAVVRFVPDAAIGWDRHDASKLDPFVAVVGLLAPVGERDGATHRHAVRSLPGNVVLPEGYSVPLGVYTNSAGTFTLAWTLDGLPDAWAVRLQDATTGAEVDLRTAPDYTFTAEAMEDWAERFTLSIALPAPRGAASALAYGLSPVYPNPARDAARVTLRVAEAQAVTVALYDVLGRRVAVLFDGTMAPGAEHEFTVDGARLPAGAYVVRVEGEAFVDARRLTILR